MAGVNRLESIAVSGTLVPYERRLFRAAVELYLGGGEAPVDEAISSARTARQAAHDLLTMAAIEDTGADTPPGCLLASSIVSCSAAAADIREELAVIRRDIERACAHASSAT